MNTEPSKRKLSAILSADAKEYSRLMSQDERGTIRTLTIYKEAMSKLVQQYKGRVVDSPGDNLLAEFISVIDAVNCAVEIQRELAEKNTELPPARQMEFRIGINLGDVVEEEGRIYGDGVNIAARLEGLAEGGGICISGTVHDQVKHKLGLEYNYLGKQTVKNIPEPVKVYRVLSFPGAAAHRVVRAKSKIVKRWHRVALAIAIIMVIGISVGVVFKYYFHPSLEPASIERMAFPLPDKPSIAVLPFVNMSDDPKQEYFADGITDDLITDLSKISGLFIIARNSVYTYKGKPVKIREIAEELGVRYVLEGSVRKAGKQVRINTQLINAMTGGHLWAERYDGSLNDVFALQDKITQKIVTALAVKLTRSEHEHFVHKETEKPLAYDILLKGWDHYRRFTPDDFAKASIYFEKAIEIDPNYGRAHAALAQTYWMGSELGWRWQMALGCGWSEGRLLARKHLAIAMTKPTSISHQVASAMNLYRRQYQEAIAEAQRAIALDPNDHRAHWILAWVLIYAGSPEEAIDFAKTAMRLDPHYTGPNLYLLGLAHFSIGKLEDAVTLFERALTHNPELCGLSAPLIAAYAHLGRSQEARVALLNYRNEWSWYGWSPNLLRVMQFFPFKDLKVSDRLADGLTKTGITGLPNEYCKISQENKLTGDEIKALVFDRSVTGFSPLTEFEWQIHRTSEGKITYHGNWPYSITTPGESGSGASWIEGDMLCDQWQYIFQGLKYCMTVYRNPEGTAELKNRFLFVTDFGIFPWSPVY